MIKIMYSQLKNISIIIISLILFGCFGQKRFEYSKLDLKDFVEDYETDFYNYCNGDSVGALNIYIKISDGYVDKIVIDDYYIKTLYRDIRLNRDSVDNIAIGVINKYPTKIFYETESDIPSSLKIPTDTSLIRKANIMPTWFLVEENGSKKEIDFDEGLAEYDPRLISAYFPSQRRKKIEIYDGRIIEMEYNIETKQRKK